MLTNEVFKAIVDEVMGNNWSVRSYKVSGLCVEARIRSNSGKSTWGMSLAFDENGNCLQAVSNQMSSTTPSYIKRQIMEKFPK